MNETIYLTLTALHVLAATIWVGGTAAVGFLLVPVIRDRRFASMALDLLETASRSFRWVGWSALGLLVATGIPLVGARGYGWADLLDWSFEPALAWKLVAVLVLLLLHGIHDTWIGPRAIEAARSEEEGGTGLRAAASWMGRITLLLSVGIVVLAVLLVRGGL